MGKTLNSDYLQDLDFLWSGWWDAEHTGAGCWRQWDCFYIHWLERPKAGHMWQSLPNSHLLHFLCCSLSSGCVEPVVNSFKPHAFFVNYNSTRISFFSWNTHPLSHIIYQLAPISCHLLQEVLLDSSSPGVRSLLNALITSCMPTCPTPVKRGASFFSTECNAWHINGCSTMLVK